MASGIDLSHLQISLAGRVSLTVSEAHTAPEIGSGKIKVLATPVMINLMEAAALDAVEALLPQGHQSLGIRLDVTHVAATPVGMRVEATARLTAIEKRTLFFRVEAHDERDLIGEGAHERVVVNLNRFDERLEAKVAMIKAR